MLCKRPYLLPQTNVPVGCGQCLLCRINRRRIWTARQVLESFMHDRNCFVTLTYNNENLPLSASVDPRETQLFMKRLRSTLVDKADGRKVRFVAVGEYGDASWRPHYHLSLFGVGQLDEDLIKSCWSKGFVAVAEFNSYTAAYVSGYVVKKMTSKDDPRLHGRHPEYARFSNRPGIGAHAMSVIADSVLTDAGLDEYEKTGDVPMQFRMGGKVWPLGRYLRTCLRKEVGVSEEDKQKVKQRFFDEQSAYVLGLLSSASDDKEIVARADLIAQDRKGKIASIEAREKISASRQRALI